LSLVVVISYSGSEGGASKKSGDDEGEESGAGQDGDKEASGKDSEED